MGDKNNPDNGLIVYQNGEKTFMDEKALTRKIEEAQKSGNYQEASIYSNGLGSLHDALAQGYQPEHINSAADYPDPVPYKTAAAQPTATPAPSPPQEAAAPSETAARPKTKTISPPLA
jgi:hypothetical protein